MIKNLAIVLAAAIPIVLVLSYPPILLWVGGGIVVFVVLASVRRHAIRRRNRTVYIPQKNR